MSENNNNENEFKVEINKEELKSQTKDTVNQVKETFKNTDFKTEANKTKGFILEVVSNPITTLKEIVTEKENRFSNAIMLIICLIATAVLEYVLSCLVSSSSYYSTKFYFKTAVLYVISPIIYIGAFSVATYLLSGQNKKNITTIISAITVGCTPFIFRNIVDMISTLVSKILSIGFVFNAFTSALYFAAMGLILYAITGLLDSDGNEDKDFRKAVVIALIAWVIIYVCSRLGIYNSI